VDEATGELLFFNYSKQAPYMHYGVVGPDNRLKHYVPIPLPGPRLPHDMAFTKNYSILNDLPLFWDPELLPKGYHAARFHRDLPTRFAIIPRYGQPEDIRWFEAKPCYVLHWMNAWEEGDEIVLDGYFQEDPEPPPLAGWPRKLGQMMAYLDEHSMKPKLYRWRFNLKTGAVKWKEKEAVGKGSIAYADGRFYLRDEKSGAIALIEASPAGYKEVGRFTQPKKSGKPLWPHPVIANGKLYIRDMDNLFCYDVKAK